MKRISFLLTLVMLVCMMVPATYATANNPQEIETVHAEYDDYEIDVVTIIYDSISRSNSRSADKVYTVRMSGKVIAEVTLSATFGYDSKTAWVISANSSHTTNDGWSYGSEKITKSGGTASLSAKLTHSRYEDIPISISITCSPTGQIS